MTTRRTTLIIGQLESGEFVAAATGEPYFCTVGHTAEEVEKRAEEAAEFYRCAKPQKRNISSPQKNVARIVPQRRTQWDNAQEVA